jgi:uncharacterized membrane protein
MPWRSPSQPTKTERIVAGVSYLTFGIAGLLYMIFSKRGDQSDWFRFHFIQSIMISVIAALVGWGVGPLSDILVQCLSLISKSVAAGAYDVIRVAMEVFSWGTRILLLYGAIFAFLGRFAEVPFISSLVRQNMR